MVETHVETGLSFSVLGPVAADREGRAIELGAPKQRALLAVLLTNPNQPISVGRIIASVWGGDASDRYRRSVQTYVSNLRAALDTEITRSGDAYMLAIDPSRIDAVRFEAKLDEARTLIATDPGLAANRLRSALAMWRGLPYADVGDVEGIQTEINRLEELRLTAVELRVDADLAAGRHRELTAEIEALANEHPLRERFRAQHMIALYRAGRQTEALRVYERTREQLAEELGVDPSQELQDLELAILRHDQQLGSGTGLTTTQRLCFLGTSIAGLTDAWDRNPQAMGESVWAVSDAITRAIQGHGGRVFNETGEGQLSVFPEVPLAVAAAQDAQKALADLDWDGLEELGVGMALDVGEAESRGESFSGPPVSRARRLAARAWGGQVLLSSTVQTELAASSVSGLQVQHIGEFELEGFARPERIAQLVMGDPPCFEGLRPTVEWVGTDGLASFSLPGYEIRELIGRSAVGAVYRGYQPSVGREVAIKIIRPTMSNHPRFFHRFETEARVIARLAHPHIVPLIDFWRDHEGAYLVLQYMPGGSLRKALDTGVIEREDATEIIAQVGLALEHAHQRGVAHGDVRPSNILLDEMGNAYLTDFDIASRLLETGAVGATSTPTSYRAPELSEAGPTTAADIYALGELIKDVFDEPAVDHVVSRATEVDAADRFFSVRELLDAFERALGDEVAVPAVILPRNPFKGLRPFNEADSDDFYGRDDLIEDLLSRLAVFRFLAVIGPSGSGKSSAVRAGLVPRLNRGAIGGSQNWPILVMSPGSDPVGRLAEGFEGLATSPGPFLQLLEEEGIGGCAERLLRDIEGEIIIVVDQFEELFSLTEDPDARGRFVDYLVDTVRTESRVRVVVTLRADFYQQLLGEPGINQLATSGQVTVLPPTRDELILMIVRPAESVGLHWESGLPERIASEVANQPGILPLLQYALTEVVDNRAGDVLAESDYNAVGGVSGALSKRADTVYSGLPAQQQRVAREVLLRLVRVDPGGDDTRRRARRGELESLGIERSDLDVVVDSFIAERLLLGDRDPVTRAPTVEVAHEALLVSWPRLSAWIDEERESLLLARRLRTARDEWIKAGEDPDYLLTGSRLTPFGEWAETASLSAGERDYLEQSKRADEQLQTIAQRRRRALAAILGIAAAVAVALSIWALVERDRAREQASAAVLAEQQAEAEADRAESEAVRAEMNRALARSRELAVSAVSELDENPELASLLAIAAVQAGPPVAENSGAGMFALRRAALSNQLYARFVADEDGPVWARINGEGSTVYTWAPLEGVASAIDTKTGERIWVYEEAGGDQLGEYSRIALSADERLVAILVFPHAVEQAPQSGDPLEPRIVVLRTADGEVETVIQPGPCPEAEFSREGFTRDGRWLVVLAGTTDCGSPVGSEDWVALYDTSSWQETTRLSIEGGAYERASFSDSGDRVLITSWNGPAELRSFPELELISELGNASIASLSPDGERVVMSQPTGGLGPAEEVDRRARVHDASTGRQLFYLDAVDDFPTGDAHIFSPDSSLVVITTGGHDYVFSMKNGRLVSDLGETGPTESAGFTSDGRTLVTATNGSVLLWDLDASASGATIAPDFADPLWINPNWALEGPRIAIHMLVVHPEAGLTIAIALLDEDGNTTGVFPGKGAQLADGRFVGNRWSVSDETLTWGPLVVWDPDTDETVELAGCVVPFALVYEARFVECPDGGKVFGEPLRLSTHVVTPESGEYFAAMAGNTANEASEIVVWETGSLEVRSSFEVPFREDLFAAGPEWLVSKDLLAQEVVVRGLSSGEQLGRFFAGPEPVVQLSPDAAVLYSGDDVGNVWAFDTSTWELIVSWKAHEARVRGLALSPDGNRLVTTAQDNTIAVWQVSDLRTTAASHPLLDRIPAQFPSDAVWLDEQRIGVFLADGAKWLEVSLSVDQLVADVLEQLTRSFTPDECVTYGIDPCPTIDDLRVLSGS